MEKAIKEMRNKKATGDDEVPGDVLKLLGEGGLKIMKIRRSHKLLNAATIAQSALSHTQQRYLEEGLKRKLRMYSEKISLDLEGEKELGMQLGC